ncbi:MAG: sigma-70 family RNA polymerase sigma factor [Chloroflexi bacterium]|nr:sigma-70 family RNA polymerase sigma factor [Chloroflexota bacterium]MCI0580128.1 sigma-70 family RNA polymerase sigma factor [Chloroflexota bacterium]MCI0649296.1 sigma-70 family RNA polymerase sigma factor [Chloroflexota bacterium]MCI0725971.1 sigma-70 family RNA polymerase sigma factor [Chloroflexota bacterium]
MDKPVFSYNGFRLTGQPVGGPAAGQDEVLSESSELESLDERALVEQARHNREAFGRLYELYVDRIYSYVYYRTGNQREAEDLTARVFMRAIQHIGRYEDQGAPFSAWLYRIARNLVANWYRDQSRRQIISLDQISHWQVEDNPELASELVENQEALLEAIRRLPSERQELLILKYVERLSNVEVGQIMGRSEGAIKSLYHRTLLSLRDELLQQEHQRKAGRWAAFRERLRK